MKIGVLGSGEVAKTLATGFINHGHDVMVGTRDGAKLAEWGAQNPGGHVGSFEATAAFGEVVVLAVKGSAAADVLHAASAANLAGKPVIDTTNPIADAPPSNGVLKFFTGPDDSLMERLQGEALSERLARAPLLDSELGEVFGALLSAVKAAHAIGIVHRKIGVTV